MAAAPKSSHSQSATKRNPLQIAARLWQQFRPRQMQESGALPEGLHVWKKANFGNTDWTRRSLLNALGTGTLWLLAGCHRSPTPQNGPASGPSASVVAPQGMLRVAAGAAGTVAVAEPMELEAVLYPEDAEIVGEPRITCHDGEIKRVTSDQGGRVLHILYQPGGGSRELNPNTTVTVAWTVRGPDTDTVILARGFVHVNDDGSYAFGYETPRPTIAEMAAPPIRQGPTPPGGM